MRVDDDELPVRTQQVEAADVERVDVAGAVGEGEVGGVLGVVGSSGGDGGGGGGGIGNGNGCGCRGGRRSDG